MTNPEVRCHPTVFANQASLQTHPLCKPTLLWSRMDPFVGQDCILRTGLRPVQASAARSGTRRPAVNLTKETPCV